MTGAATNPWVAGAAEPLPESGITTDFPQLAQKCDSAGSTAPHDQHLNEALAGPGDTNQL